MYILLSGRKLRGAVVLGMVILFMLTLQVTCFADTLATTPNTGGSVALTLDAEPTIYSFVGPSVLPVTMTSDATTVEATDLLFQNTSPSGGIKFVSISFTGSNGYTIADYDDEFTRKKVGSQVFGFMLNTVKVQTDGSLALDATNFPVLYPNDTLPIIYDVKLPTVRTLIEDLEIGSMLVTTDWDSI